MSVQRYSPKDIYDNHNPGDRYVIASNYDAIVADLAHCEKVRDQYSRLWNESEARVQALQRTLERHATFRDAAVDLVRDLRLALLQGDYLSKQKMDVRSDAWLREVDGPRLQPASQPQVDQSRGKQ